MIINIPSGKTSLQRTLKRTVFGIRFLHFIRAHCLPAALLAIVFAGKAWCWNDAGHMVVNLIAYDLLDDDLRREAVALLRQHPRFEQHFLGTMPQEIWSANDALKNEWIFARAANWPDLVRERSDVVTAEDALRFNRPLWHYVDFPVYVSSLDEQKLAGQIHVNLGTEPPADRDALSMNVLQAIKNSSRIVADRSAPASLRAIHLCWLCHLVGDSHQPLHTSALFTTQRFPEGDSGGNLLFVGERKTLHSYWDGRVLDIRDFSVIRRKAREFGSDSTCKQMGQTASQVRDPAIWVAEGRELARTYVYTDPIRQMVAAAEGQSELPNIDLPPSYERDARQIVQRRVVIAGYRLADLIRRLLGK